MMRAAAALLALALVAALPARAGDPAAPEAQAAASELRDAIDALNTAERGSDRVAALTRTIQAYESGLGVLRDTLRRASAREAEIQASFAARRERIGHLLGIMAMMERDPAPLLLLHPDGPVGTARSGMILSSVTPALQQEAETLRGQLEELQRVRALQADVTDTLQRGLDAAQEARTTLSQAIQGFCMAFRPKNLRAEPCINVDKSAEKGLFCRLFFSFRNAPHGHGLRCGRPNFKNPECTGICVSHR